MIIIIIKKASTERGVVVYKTFLPCLSFLLPPRGYRGTHTHMIWAPWSLVRSGQRLSKRGASLVTRPFGAPSATPIVERSSEQPWQGRRREETFKNCHRRSAGASERKKWTKKNKKKTGREPDRAVRGRKGGKEKRRVSVGWTSMGLSTRATFQWTWSFFFLFIFQTWLTRVNVGPRTDSLRFIYIYIYHALLYLHIQSKLVRNWSEGGAPPALAETPTIAGQVCM